MMEEILKYTAATLAVITALVVTAKYIKESREMKAETKKALEELEQRHKEMAAIMEHSGSILRSCTETEPRLELRKQYIVTGAVTVYIAPEWGGKGYEIAYFDDEDPEFNSLQADELIEAMTRAKSDYLLTTTLSV